MIIIANILQFFAIGLLIVSIVQMARTHFLSKALQIEIDETHRLRVAALESGNAYHNINYPNIDATYANLKWYKLWQRPSTLIVYDKEV